MIIGVDMGHSLAGAGTGAVGLLSEVDQNRKIGNRFIQMLKENGHIVVNCTVDYANSTNSQLAGIVAKANAQNLDLFVSIHLNSGGGVGTEIFVYGTGGKAETYARKILPEVVASCGFRNRGLKTANYYVLRETKAPAVLLEVCFVDSQEDAGKLNVEAVARAMFKGVTGTEYKAPVQESQPAVLGYGTVTASVLNVRDGASTTAPIIGQLKQGQRVKVGFKQGGWYNIFFGSHGGWVSAQYLKL